MITDSEAQSAADRAEEDMARLIDDAKKWRNAMQSEQKCGNCRFYWNLVQASSQLDSDGDVHFFSACRRFPKLDSQAGYDSTDPRKYHFPVVYNDDWCGEWQPAQQTGGKDGDAC